VQWDDFVKILKKLRTIVFTTSADIYSGRSVNASCEVQLRDWELQILESEQFIAAVCTDIESDRKTYRPRPARREGASR